MATNAPILSPAALRDIAQTIVQLSSSDLVKVEVQHTAHSVTHTTHDRIIGTDNGERIELTAFGRKGGRNGIRLRANQVNDQSIRAWVQSLDSLAQSQFGSAKDPFPVYEGPQQYIPVSLWHVATINAMRSGNEDAIGQIMAELNSAGVEGVCFIGLMARTTVVLQKDGLEAHSEETDCECTVTARTTDGSSSGWSGDANRDWSKIAPGRIAREAIDIAKRGVKPLAVEPGRRTAILSSFAMAQIMRHVAHHFSADNTHRKGTAFSVLADPARESRVGLQVFDRRLRMTSDPADPDGGYPPYGDMAEDFFSMPLRKVTWIERGVLQRLAYSVQGGLENGQPFNQVPWSMRLELEAGNAPATVEAMIESCHDGLFVNRFSDINETDFRTGMQTGVTRDGCFLVRNGKIERPVKNLRYTDSPFLFLNSLLAVGTPRRAPLGFVQGVLGEARYASEWPRRPIIVPPLMVRDFNFTALSDAV